MIRNGFFGFRSVRIPLDRSTACSKRGYRITVNPSLVDTNAWITYFDPEYRGMPDIANEVERLIENELACYTEIIYIELFTGVKSEEDVKKFKRAFSALPLKSLIDKKLWNPAYQNAYKLWKSGTKFKLVDLIIATVAIYYGIVLFHNDKDFLIMKRALPLQEYNFLQKK
ncbi:MAG: PIN domain-containing protein [Actinomycetota bacterium]|nr:PIN domain-containing protein [Actinomycetota bacterium]